MKKEYTGRLLGVLLATFLVTGLAACGAATGEAASDANGTSAPEAAVISPDTPTPAPTQEPPETNILIVYFTWAENTVVDNPSAVDADAITLASVLAPGHVARMARWIQEETGGDLFSILVTEPYSSNYDACLDRAADEKAENARRS